MNLNDAFDALKSARRADDGSVLAMAKIAQAVFDLQGAVHFETMSRAAKQQVVLLESVAKTLTT